MPDFAIEIRGLRKVFAKGKDRVVAVDGLDLEVPRGEIFGLLGPNGAGKTTTVEICEGLLEPTEGEVEVLGLRWSRGEGPEIRQRIGVTLQDTRFFEKQTVHEILTLFRSFYESGRTVEEVIAMFSLEEKRDARTNDLSGGQRQRLAVACALVSDPELLFLDEPTTGLDPQSRRQLWGAIEGYRKAGGTVLMTTHYMEEAEHLCDRVGIVDHGKIIALDTPAGLIGTIGGEHIVEAEIDGLSGAVTDDDVRALPTVQAHTFDGDHLTMTVEATHLVVPGLLQLLAAKGLAMDGLATRTTSLEDVFVKLTGRQLRDGGGRLMRARVVLQVAFLTFREFIRTPGSVFWTYGFPLIMAVSLGFAFQSKAPPPIPVAVVESDFGAEDLRRLEANERLSIVSLTEKVALEEFQRGKHLLVLVQQPDGLQFRYDPTRPEAELALLHVRASLAPPGPAPSHVDLPETTPGWRYIDWLIPGLISLNLLGAGLWGVGFNLVQMRVKNILKRLMVTPMHRSEFITAFLLSRLVLVVPEAGAILAFGYFLFDVPIAGSLFTVLVLVFLGAISFTGLGMLIASRVRTIETVSGLMNLTMLPMWILGGSFFSSERFPDIVQPLVWILPITQMNNALRAVMTEGHGLLQVLPEVAFLAVFSLLAMGLAIRCFRWT